MSGDIFSYQTLVHAISGSVGSVTAMTAFYPLDTIRARLQLEDREAKNTLVLLKELCEEEGFETLYRGMIPVLKSLCASNFVYFYSFHGLKKYCSNHKIPASALRDLFLGSIAGIINVLTTTPLWVVNTRMKLQGLASSESSRRIYSGLLDGLIKITKSEGLAALWSGTLPSLMLVINPAIQFMTYEGIKRRLANIYGKDAKFSALVFFMIGAVSKTIATILTYPLQIVQTKLRHGHKMEGLRANANMFEIFNEIIRKSGMKGLFKGMEAKILQTVLMSALMFTLYEKISSSVFKIMGLGHAKK